MSDSNHLCLAEETPEVEDFGRLERAWNAARANGITATQIEEAIQKIGKTTPPELPKQRREQQDPDGHIAGEAVSSAAKLQAPEE